MKWLLCIALIIGTGWAVVASNSDHYTDAVWADVALYDIDIEASIAILDDCFYIDVDRAFEPTTDFFVIEGIASTIGGVIRQADWTSDSCFITFDNLRVSLHSQTLREASIMREAGYSNTCVGNFVLANASMVMDSD